MLRRSDLEERKKRGLKTKEGNIPKLGSSAQFVELMIDRNKSNELGNREYNVRHLSFKVGGRVLADFQRNDRSKNKVNQRTVVAIKNHINHFLCWLQINDREEELNHVISLIVDIDRMLLKEKINAECELNIDEVSVFEVKTFRDREKEYFLKVVKERVVSDIRLMKIVTEYTHDITLYNNTSPQPTSPLERKLENIDIHVLHVLSFYSKILFIFYFRIGGVGTWISIIKDVLVELGILANEEALESVFQDAIPEKNAHSFIDRIYEFLEFSMKKPLYENKNNLQKFSCLGFSEMQLLHVVADDILSLLYRLNMVVYDDVDRLEVKIHESNDDTTKDCYQFEDINDFPLIGLVDANTASYIHAAKGKVVTHKVGKFNPEYIIRSFDGSDRDDSGDDGTDDSSKFEMHLEKVDKEWSEKFQEIAAVTLKGIKENIINEDLAPLLIRYGIKKNTFNQFMVSVYLECIHGCDFSKSLTNEDFIYVLVKIHEILVYPKLKFAILGEIDSRTNSNQVEECDVSSYYLMTNKNKVLKTLSEMTKYIYTTREMNDNGVKISNVIDIRDELLEFINNGCDFSKRGIYKDGNE